MTDPDIQELVAKLKHFLAYCDDTSLPRPAGTRHESIPAAEPEVA
jgi:hypothetical protein